MFHLPRSFVTFLQSHPVAQTFLSWTKNMSIPDETSLQVLLLFFCHFSWINSCSCSCSWSSSYLCSCPSYFRPWSPSPTWQKRAAPGWWSRLVACRRWWGSVLQDYTPLHHYKLQYFQGANFMDSPRNSVTWGGYSCGGQWRHSVCVWGIRSVTSKWQV